MNHIVWHNHQITKAARAEQKQQKPCLIWFTGLSGSGKSTLAGALEQELFNRGHHSYLLDGDNVRHGLNKDLGFTDADRVENIRRIGEMAKLFVDAGMIVLSAFISPFKAERRMVRELVEAGEFIEVHLDTPLSACEERDPKGLYKKARAGEIRNFTGIDSEYERPENPELRVDTSVLSVEDSAKKLVDYLVANKIIRAK
ncbi:adenylyl-sulfate kinase [Motiliproteus sp. SC1-56]|uniref:adenylyl-sulfate kinase n=1 Tax=Motiliproteus sp. SC1-56 TaxID=2799565 RepID=UPI001A8F520E|nr:adenylyl-sulfate kinase [Motiliproteus sp. SC1-56]